MRNPVIRVVIQLGMYALSGVWPLAASAASYSGASVQAADLMTDVRARGANAVVTMLWADNKQWAEVMKNIGQGKAEWLKVAVALRPGTDAGATETLDEAVFIALKPAPAAVLFLMVDHRFDPKFVCSSNIATDFTDTESRRFIRDRIKILTSLSDPNLEAIRDQCVAGLRAALKDVNGANAKSGAP
jgi:hypothetical protein